MQILSPEECPLLVCRDENNKRCSLAMQKILDRVHELHADLGKRKDGGRDSDEKIGRGSDETGRTRDAVWRIAAKHALDNYSRHRHQGWNDQRRVHEINILISKPEMCTEIEGPLKVRKCWIDLEDFKLNVILGDLTATSSTLLEIPCPRNKLDSAVKSLLKYVESSQIIRLVHTRLDAADVAFWSNGPLLPVFVPVKRGQSWTATTRMHVVRKC